uniref:CDC20/Fizzy WD40 domain-containing protein n=1 Tax=Gadus morhua TaxID=8049 RepID=A0A8C5CVU6_GADMO
SLSPTLSSHCVVVRRGSSVGLSAVLVCSLQRRGSSVGLSAVLVCSLQRWRSSVGLSAVGVGRSKGVPEEGALLCDSSGPRRDGPGVRTTAAEADQPPEPPAGHTTGPVCGGSLQPAERQVGGPLHPHPCWEQLEYQLPLRQRELSLPQSEPQGQGRQHRVRQSHKLLRSPRKPARKISKIPFKVLDAPELQDDFYLNLVDWSAGNLLSVGLGACVYLWSACTSQVTRLCDLSVDGDSVTSVCWNERGSLVAVGTHKGYVQIWDAAGGRKLSSLEGHSARVGALAWNGEQLSSGSRDRVILQRDVRSPPGAERRLQGHRQEVCGLKWSPDHQHLASGGNDNKLLVWNSSSLLPMQQYSDHLAAVKAIAWSPHQHGLLASGGGTADRCLRFWNTLTGQPLQSTDTGSQVCNLAWSKHANELVSTHGYSQNQILVWKYPSLTQVAKLTGHSYRVLYLAVSPDGEAIVTGAGDETLRFWNVFSKTRCTKESKSVLNLFTRIR